MTPADRATAIAITEELLAWLRAPKPVETEPLTEEERERKLLDVILRREGGFVNNPHDAGGATNFGITAATLGAYMKLGGPASAADVQALTKPLAELIYRQLWLRHPSLNLSQIESVDVALAIFDTDILFARPQAAKWAQKAVGVPQDGILGPVSIAAINAADPRKVILGIFRERMLRHARRVESDPSQAVFIEGWTNRSLELLDTVVA